MRRKITSFALTLAAALAACGGDGNSLSGSIGRTTPLGFDIVQVRRLQTSYTIAYLKGSDTIARLAFTPSGAITAGAPQALNFANGGNAGVSRAAADRLTFPTGEGGNITFDRDPGPLVAGDAVTGTFGLRFTSGDTLSGEFSAPLGIASATP